MCMKLSEVERRLAAGETASSISARAWRRRLNVINRKNIKSAKGLVNLLVDNNVELECALCFKYNDNCSLCPLFKADNGHGCIDFNCNSVFSKYSKATTRKMLVLRTEEVIAKLEEADKIERAEMERKP